MSFKSKSLLQIWLLTDISLYIFYKGLRQHVQTWVVSSIKIPLLCNIYYSVWGYYHARKLGFILFISFFLFYIRFQTHSPIFPSLTSILLPKSFWTWLNGSPNYFPLASLLSYCIHLTSLQFFSILIYTPYLVKKKSNHITSLLSIYLSIIICNKTQISRW